MTKQFTKERDKALLSLDKIKIMAYLKKYGIEPAKDELVFWAGIHKAILGLNSATDEQKDRSRAWLYKNGFKPVPPYFNLINKFYTP